MKYVKRIDIINGEPVVLDTPVAYEHKPPALEYYGSARIYETYSDYLTEEENDHVYLTTAGITVNTGEYLFHINQGRLSFKEVADIIRGLLKEYKPSIYEGETYEGINKNT